MRKHLTLTVSSQNPRTNVGKSDANISPGLPEATYGFNLAICPKRPGTCFGKG